ncbi:hypothetical protein GWI33_011741 [Rhynchophorus ferrugineus]|uniref:Uncharacterized protein n=1 Tax=Rhynchophorus ferrugineus TaxID=354439 RepID=A0A834IB89_RHYFE|nr:hypothetical protein GWI33_011741 [Rhynchophorus ferrugineus]
MPLVELIVARHRRSTCPSIIRGAISRRKKEKQIGDREKNVTEEHLVAERIINYNLERATRSGRWRKEETKLFGEFIPDNCSKRHGGVKIHFVFGMIQLVFRESTTWSTKRPQFK